MSRRQGFWPLGGLYKLSHIPFDILIMRLKLNPTPSLLYIVVLTLEALLAVTDLSQFSGAVDFAKYTGQFIPVVRNFLSDASSDPNVAPFIALTFALLPVKIYASCIIFFRHKESDKALIASFPSSASSTVKKIYSTALVFLMNALCVLYILFYGDGFYTSSSVTRSITNKYYLVSEGGVGMWLGWSVMHLTVMAFVVGLLFVFIIEWLRLIQNKTKE